MSQGATTERSVIIGLGEYHVARDPSLELVCLGIGSCIAFAGYDPVAHVAALAHFVLPDGSARSTSTAEARFVDLGVPLILREMKSAGAIASRIIFKIAGGSQMTVARGFESRLNIGERNYEAVKRAMADRNLKITSEDCGGSQGRTVRLNVESGKMFVSKVGGEAREL
jgi:chemotaxis protein CheD